MGMFLKFAQWASAPDATLYHWCPACEELHVIPAEGWTRHDGQPEQEDVTYTPSFGQHTKRGYCHYNITRGKLIFHGDSYHSMRGEVELPDIPIEVLERKGMTVGVKTDAIFRS